MISFFAPGIPIGGGSKKGFMVAGHINIVDASGEKGRNWRATVAIMGRKECPSPLAGPLKVQMIFHLPRPKAHSRGGDPTKGLKLNAPFWHDKKPDVIKLARSTEDALTGICWSDDSQIAVEMLEKRYSDTPGAEIRIEML